MAEKRLADLSPEWVWWGPGKKLVQGLEMPEVGMDRIGVAFDCPTCNPPHNLAAFWAHPDQASGTWVKKGETFESLTLFPSLDASSVEGLGCCFHGWVKHGKVTW